MERISHWFAASYFLIQIPIKFKYQNLTWWGSSETLEPPSIETSDRINQHDRCQSISSKLAAGSAFVFCTIHRNLVMPLWLRQVLIQLEAHRCPGARWSSLTANRIRTQSLQKSFSLRTPIPTNLSLIPTHFKTYIFSKINANHGGGPTPKKG